MDDLEALQRLIGTPDLCSKRWVWEQYDHVIGGNTVQRPGGDAAVVRVEEGPKALALTTDVTPRYCEADPFEGGKQAVAEAWRNITAVGGLPLAITDNLNFGNPEKPEIMGQFVGCVRGIAEACKALDFPVVSGNVSLYNETQGRADSADARHRRRRRAGRFPQVGDAVVQGRGRRHPSGRGHRRLARPVDLSARDLWPGGGRSAAGRSGDRAAQRRLRARADREPVVVTAVHDLSDGGLLVAVAEMAIAGRLGAALDAAPPDRQPHGYWFGEDQARYLLTVPPGAYAGLITQAAAVGVPMRRIGTVGGETIALPGERPILVQALVERFEGWLPAYMAGGAP